MATTAFHYIEIGTGQTPVLISMPDIHFQVYTLQFHYNTRTAFSTETVDKE
jgi:hypothetical protein